MYLTCPLLVGILWLPAPTPRPLAALGVHAESLCRCIPWTEAAGSKGLCIFNPERCLLWLLEEVAPPTTDAVLRTESATFWVGEQG